MIFLVIVGHVIQYYQYQNKDFWADPVFKAIYLFHMPLFILVSGYFAAKSLTKHGFRTFLRYLERLILPCVGTGIVFFVFAWINGTCLLDGIYDGCLALWFLIVVFECFIFYSIMQWKKAWWYKALVFILPIPIAIVIGQHSSLSMLWPYTHQFTYLWPIFIIGAFLANTGFTSQCISWKWSIFLIIFIVSYALFQPSWYVYRWPLSLQMKSIILNLFRTITALAGCGMFLCITKYITRYISRFSIIQNIGRSTLAIYALQTILFAKIQTDFGPYPTGYGEVVLMSIVILGCLYLIYRVTSRIPVISTILYGERIKTKIKQSQTTL